MAKCTYEQRNELLALNRRLRLATINVGEMHGFWDLIFDIEAFLSDRPMVVPHTAQELIDEAVKDLRT